MFEITCSSVVTASRCAGGVVGLDITGNAVNVFVPYALVVLPPIFTVAITADNPILLKWPIKDPATERDYGVDWSAVLQTHEKIVFSFWDVESGIEVFDSKITPDGKCSIAWIRGGEDGKTYIVTNTIVTNRGVREERFIRLVVKEL